MKPVTMYESKDGELFATEDACNKHEEKQALSDSFNPIYGSSEGCKIYFGDFLDWYCENKEWLNMFIRVETTTND